MRACACIHSACRKREMLFCQEKQEKSLSFFILFAFPKRMKDIFCFIVLLCEEKYQKSARRTRAVLLPNHRRRARVSRASHAWRVRAANGKAKVGGFALRAISAIPRVRTYHTRESSRFVHALPARPLKNVWRAWVWQVR